jgi:hypothetical protein
VGAQADPGQQLSLDAKGAGGGDYSECAPYYEPGGTRRVIKTLSPSPIFFLERVTMRPSIHPARFNCLGHFLRPPSWRWLRAVDLADNRQPAHEEDDHWVRQAMRFCHRLRHSPGAAALEELAQDMPALFQAHSLFTAPPSFQRWEIEARLLTHEPFEQVALKCASQPEVIDAYHAVFFHVRDRLDASGYIRNMVIGPKLLFGLTEDDVDIILKLYAYNGGPYVLDLLVDYYRHPPVVPEHLEQLAPEALEELRTKLLIRAAILARVLPIDDTLVKKLELLLDAVAVLEQGGTLAGLSAPLQALLLTDFSFGEKAASSQEPLEHPAKGPALRTGARVVAVA